ncbi:MAG: Mur ligase domain-containing protein [Acidaminococcus intestini]
MRTTRSSRTGPFILMMGKLFATSSGRETEHDQNRSHKKATQAKTLLPDSIDFIDVSTDSRSIGPGTLFVALRGEKFDGHDYVAAALEKGATAALVDHNPGVAPQNASSCLTHLRPIRRLPQRTDFPRRTSRSLPLPGRTERRVRRI